MTAQSDLMAVRGAFENSLSLPPVINKSAAVAIFGGHAGPYAIPGSSAVPTVPSGDVWLLEQSAFGQMVSIDIPYPNFEDDKYTAALAMLYWEYADAAEKDKAAFIYKYKLYGRDSAEGKIEAQFSDIAMYWDATRRARAWEAAQLLLDALKYAPWNVKLRWAVLDIYYDIAVADIAVASEKLVEAYKVSLGLVAPPPGEFLISEEITKMEEALQLYRFAIEAYFGLLANPLGVDITPYDEPEVPFGYYIFKTEVPNRSLYSPLMKDAEGDWVLPSEFTGKPEDQEPLFSRYKDLVMIFNAQRDYATVAAELARRYIMRGMPATQTERSDMDKAGDLISRVQQQSYLEGAVLTGIFPDISGTMKGVAENSGLVEAAYSWRAKVAELNYLQAYLNGESNLLGFTEDFLTLVQPPQGSNTESYDYYVSFIKNESTGPLDVALKDLEKAQTDYENYRDRLDRLSTEYHDRNETYDTRLFEITGAYPGTAAYETPFENEGSLLSQQWLSIEIALNRIEANKQEIDNLQKQVEIEVWRRGQEHNINDAISSVYIQYGEKQAKLTEEIGLTNAAQAIANNLAASLAGVSAGFSIPPSFNMSFSTGVIAYAVNAFVQAGLEFKKSGLQADKERLGAQQSAQIQSLNDQLLDVDSKANIKTWLLRMNTLVIESEEAALSLEQEWGKMTGLLAEREDLESRKAESQARTADMYFADPIHRSKKNSSIIRAEHTFLWAQHWMYLAARALEYKWNKPFIKVYLNKTYTKNTLLGLRNAAELGDLYLAMHNWDADNKIARQSDNSFTKFSFKRDFLGFYCSSASAACCMDPVSGAPATALDAFRSYLKQPAVQIQPSDDPKINPLRTKTALRLTFSTVKEDAAGVFFSPARWNEKISSMRVKVFGGAPVGSPSRVGGYISYGGTNFLRTANPGAVEPISPSLKVPEMRAYASKSWYKDETTGMWRSRDTRSGAINVQVSSDPDSPDDAYEVEQFHEYSVANSEWVLYIALKDGDTWLLDLDAITDIEIHVKSKYNSRQNKSESSGL